MLPPISCVPLVLPVAFVMACSGENAGPLASGGGGGLLVDRVAPVYGVADRGADPAVVAISAPRQPACAGVLVAPDVVLTARHCMSLAAAPLTCPAPASSALGLRAPGSLLVLVGDDIASAEGRARGRQILVPPGDGLCAADLALLLLDQPIDDLEPIGVRAIGVALGGHVRTVGFPAGPETGLPDRKVLRDHVPVLDMTDTELRLAEAANRGGGGAPALDETTGEVLGVASRAADDTSNVYTRGDAFLSFIRQATAESAARLGVSRAVHRLKAKKGPFDLGAECDHGTDCAAGVCASDGTRRYCSRECSAHDHCPVRFRCQKGEEATGQHRVVWACAEK